MKKASDFMRSKEEQKKFWKEYRDKQADSVGEVQNAGMNTVARLMCLEVMGGKCSRCQREWQKVSFEGIFYSGEYWKPNCNCYTSCPRCGSNLYIEEVTGKITANDNACTNCNWAFSETKRQMNIESLKSDSAKIFLDKYYKQILRNPRRR